MVNNDSPAAEVGKHLQWQLVLRVRVGVPLVRI